MFEIIKELQRPLKILICFKAASASHRSKTCLSYSVFLLSLAL